MEHSVQIEVLQDFVNNNVKEWHRENPLVLPSEEGILKAVSYTHLTLPTNREV